MSKLRMITLVGAIAVMLAFGIGVSNAAGPSTGGQGSDRDHTTGTQPLQYRSDSFENDWNIERGMMGSGWHNGTGAGMLGVYPWETPPYRQFETPIDKKDARVLLQNYLDSTNNPNLKLGQETDNGTGYELDILTKDNSLVDRLLVNKATGEIYSAY
jgi:hypothetical protein